MTAQQWLERYAAEIDAPVPTQAEIDQVLELAGVAAHASERIAAPVATWMAGVKGISLAEALAAARKID